MTHYLPLVIRMIGCASLLPIRSDAQKRSARERHPPPPLAWFVLIVEEFRVSMSNELLSILVRSSRLVVIYIN